MREMKDSGIGWVHEIPKNWNVIKGKYIFSNNKTIVGAKVDLFERLALTMNGVIKRSKEATDGLQPDKFNTYQILREGELVFKLIDLQNISTSRVGLSPYTGIVSPAYIILKPTEVILPEYAEKYYLMMWHNQVFNALGDSGVRSSLNASELLEIAIPLPSIEEQKQIALFLNAECDKIDSIYADVEKQIEILEQCKRSVITEAVTRGLNPNVELCQSGIDYIDKTPKHWKIKRLKYILTERNERSITGTETLLSVSQYLGVIPSSDNKMRTMQADSLVGYKVVKKDDLVFNKLNPGLARFGWSNYDGITSPDFAVYVVDKKECSAKFLQYLLKTERYVTSFKGIGLGVGDGFARLYTPQLYNYFVSIPAIDELNEIVAYLEQKCAEIESVIADKKKQLEVLDNYKKSLIYEYVTGKKEVVNE